MTTAPLSQSRSASLVFAPLAPAGHYTTAKLLDLHAYIDQTNPWQAAVTILAAPLPGLAAALLPALLPLQRLRSGATLAFYGHLFIVMLFITAGAVASCVVVTRVPSSVYSMREVALVSLCCAVIMIALTVPLCVCWRFPVPFYWMFGACIWLTSASLSHVLVLRSKCWLRPELRAAVRLYGLGLLVQVLQIVIYPAISVLFDHVAVNYQIAITLLVPFVKFCIKRCLQLVTRELTDQHGVVVVCAVEICSSLYQSMIMQTTPSYSALAALMVLDVAHGLVSIKFFLDRPAAVPRRQLVAKALSLLRQQQRVIPATTQRHRKPLCAVRPWPSKSTLRRVDGSAVVLQALSVTHVAETVLLVEYFEVMVPLVNCAFLVVASALPSAAFNTRLSMFHHDPARLRQATQSILLYASLQALSFGAMHAVMKYRYGLSAVYHLAFVLDRHRVPIQGKMIAWLPFILHFMTVQYGTDFSFEFQFQTWTQW